MKKKDAVAMDEDMKGRGTASGRDAPHDADGHGAGVHGHGGGQGGHEDREKCVSLAGLGELSTYDLLALMPCPIKVPMERKVSEFARRSADEGDLPLEYRVISNAVMQEDVFADIDQAESIDDLPDIMIAPGFSRFFHPPFVRRFRETGCFRSVLEQAPSEAFAQAGIVDPDNCYDIIAFNPLVLLVDTSANPDLPIPRSWLDLCDPAYEDKVALRGHDETGFCEGVTLTLYRMGGYDALRDLGRSVCARLHPSEMVKGAGRHRSDAPAVCVIPFSFARLVHDTPDVHIIWPDEGAIVNPVVMLSKRETRPEIRRLARLFVTPEGAQTFEDVGFCSVCPDLSRGLPSDARFSWLGWDFLTDNDVAQLTDECNEAVSAVFNPRKGLPSRRELIELRTARRGR